MATAFGSAQSYIQSGGRLLRSYPGLENVTLQDHGGNFWRHGSLNVDRSWTLDDTSRSIFNRRADAIREKRERAPVVCPECGRALTRKVCPCGHVVSAAKLPRAVFTTDGQLTAMAADYFPVHKRTSNPDLIASWITVWRRACTVKWYATWLQAEAFFAREVTQGFYPDRNWPLMPIDRDRDIGRKVLETPVDRLRGSPETLAKYRHWQENQLAKLEQSNGESIPQRNGEDQEEAPPEEPAGDGAAEERED
jgi:hypothetical protein